VDCRTAQHKLRGGAQLIFLHELTTGGGKVRYQGTEYAFTVPSWFSARNYIMSDDGNYYLDGRKYDV
jgi:hypothetical protein